MATLGKQETHIQFRRRKSTKMGGRFKNISHIKNLFKITLLSANKFLISVPICKAKFGKILLENIAMHARTSHWPRRLLHGSFFQPRETPIKYILPTDCIKTVIPHLSSGHSNTIWVSFCRAGKMAVSCHFFCLRRAFVWPKHTKFN